MIACEIVNHVAFITLNRPAALNALSLDMLLELRAEFERAAADPDIRAVFLQGAGEKAFCAGGDVKGMGGSAPKTEMSLDDRVANLRTKQRTLTGALVAVRKPTIAALPGPAAGAGMAIALACDIRIAAESAFMSTGYARIGLTGDYGIAWLLTRLAGTARARELMFLSERIDARRCEAIGLVNRVVPDSELREAAFALARELAQGPAFALGRMKNNLDHALASGLLDSMDQEAENMVLATRTTDHKEAVRAFVEKRKPTFAGS